MIGPLLLRAQRRAGNAFNVALEPLEIQGRHFGVLMALSRSGPSSQRALIAQLGSEKSAMVRVLDELEARGLCERRPDPADRRAHSVALTPAGERLFAEAQDLACEVAEQLLGPFERAERDALLGLLERFIEEAH